MKYAMEKEHVASNSKRESWEQRTEVGDEKLGMEICPKLKEGVERGEAKTVMRSVG